MLMLLDSRIVTLIELFFQFYTYLIKFLSILVTFSMTSTMKFYYTKTLKTLFGDYKNVDTVDEFWNYMEGMAILVVEFKGR